VEAGGGEVRWLLLRVMEEQAEVEVGGAALQSAQQTSAHTHTREVRAYMTDREFPLQDRRLQWVNKALLSPF
jgi:hypothetical protein